MTVTDRIKILDRKIMRNEAQYDLDRKAVKISTFSNNLDKYEYLTGEDLSLKTCTVEQAKFEYSLLVKIFNKGFDKDDEKKEGLLKGLKNIEDKNEEQLKLFCRANKISKLAKNENDYNYNNKFAFYGFYRDFQNFKNRSLEYKYDDISKFCMALNEFKKYDAITAETEEHKARVMNNVVTL